MIGYYPSYYKPQVRQMTVDVNVHVCTRGTKVGVDLQCIDANISIPTFLPQEVLQGNFQ